jgi:hypothetical protein
MIWLDELVAKLVSLKWGIEMDKKVFYSERTCDSGVMSLMLFNKKED